MRYNKSLRIRDYVKYIVVYLLICAVIVWIVSKTFSQYNTKSLIWSVDGVPQYMIWLKYTGAYLRDTIQSILHGKFSLKMYDFHIGMGGDVHSFFKKELILLFSVFLTDPDKTSEVYSALSIARAIIAGLSFSAYGFYMKKKGPQVLAGALTYVFSGYTFYLVERHPQFGVAIIMMPLLLIGLEQVMKKQNILFYSLMVAVTLWCSYYFLYMITIMMGFYVLIRIRTLYPKDTISEFIGTFFRIVGSYLLGCGLSCVVFLPTIASFTGSSRGEIKTGLSAIKNIWMYNPQRILKILLYTITPKQDAGYMTPVSATILAVPALCMLFGGKIKEKLSLKVAFILEMIFLCVPLCAYVMSGFSNINNRWAFGYAFLIGVIVMMEFDEFSNMSWKQFLLMIIVALVLNYTRVTFCASDKAADTYYIAVIALAGLIALLAIMRVLKVPKLVWNLVLLAVVIVSVTWNGYAMNSRDYVGMVDSFAGRNEAERHFENSKYHYLADIDDDSFYRCDSITARNNNFNNAAVVLGYNGISIYNSTINENIINYLMELENSGLTATNRVVSMDGCSALEELACVKYYFSNDKGENAAPYGFELNEKLSEGIEDYAIYENQYALPIGYTYTSYMTRTEYEKLSALEKQQAQLQCAIIEDKEAEKTFSSLEEKTKLNKEVFQGLSAEVIELDKGVTKVEGEQSAYNYNKRPDGVALSDSNLPKIHLQCAVRAGCEVYLRFKNLQAPATKTSRTEIRVNYDGKKKWINYRTEKDTYGLKNTDYMLNLGYYDSDDTLKFSLQFFENCKVSWDDIEVYYVSMTNYKDEVSDLAKDALTDVKIETNKVSGKVESDSDQILTLSIPYAKGWTAYVDGEKTEISKVNTMYMGLYLPAGDHEIVMKYSSPGIKKGAVISLISLLIYLSVFVGWIRKRKERKRKKEEILRKQRRRRKLRQKRQHQKEKEKESAENIQETYHDRLRTGGHSLDSKRAGRKENKSDKNNTAGH